MNLAHILEQAPDDSVALIYQNQSTDFASLRQRVADLRAGLVGQGVRRGDRVMIVCGNSDLFVVSYFAILGIGAVAVPLNPASPAPELRREFDVIAPVAAVVGPLGVGTYAQLDLDIPTIVCDTNSALPNALRCSELEGPATDIVEMEPDEPAAMLFTSGTAGFPKAAILSHKNLLANLDNIAAAPDHINTGDVVYGVLPLFHIFGLNVQLAVSIRVGATLVLVQRFDPLTAVQTIRTRKVTVIPGAPAMWNALSQLDDIDAAEFASVRLAYSGASRLSPRVAATVLERFGIDIGEGYGLTEASPVVTTSAGIEHKPGSCGKAASGVEVKIVDGAGDVVPIGDTGEVLVRGDNVFSGYLDHPEATEAALTSDGWLRTGDLGFADEDGYLFLVDRAKDLIIVSGFNVFPGEVEDVLTQHPAVTDAAVIGVAHPHSGEAVRAYVVVDPSLAEDPVDEDAMIEFCLDRIARYKAPSKVLFVNQLPRNASGKLVRGELEQTVLSD